jgi:hypothetical protein
MLVWLICMAMQLHASCMLSCKLLLLLLVHQPLTTT